MTAEPTSGPPGLSSWRVAVIRDEGPDGPLSQALRDCGFAPHLCPVAHYLPPMDPAPLAAAARGLDRYDWVVFASRRAVDALTSARTGAWPLTVRTAAVGVKTAAALIAAGANSPVVSHEPGADALWAVLKDREAWPGKRVLLPAVAGGRRVVIDGLVAAGADVTVIEAYRMLPRATADIAADWVALSPDAAVVASPSAAARLVDAIGPTALAALHAIVAIGATTAGVLEERGVRTSVPPAADFAVVARHLADLRIRAARV